MDHISGAADVNIQGAGSTLGAPLYDEALFAYRFVEPSVEVTYAALGSGSGKCRIMSYSQTCASTDVAEPHDIDFAGSDSLLSAQNYLDYPDIQMYPTVASAVVAVYNLGGPHSLVLTMSALAGIFSGRIQTWDDPAINASNPNMTSWNIPPRQPIQLVVRADSSGTTEIFKKSLAGSDERFAQQVGESSNPVWANVTVTMEEGTQGIVSYVMTTPYSIGYCNLGDAVLNELPMASILKGDLILVPSVTSLEYAVLELGLNFGNNGDNPAHLTADIHNAQGANAWPIAGYTYLVMRKSTLRAGATCANVQATMDFWNWFWLSPVVASVAQGLGFCTLPELVRNAVLDRFTRDIMCNGAPVWSIPNVTVISGIGLSAAAQLVQKVARIYALSAPDVTIDYQSGSIQQASIPQSLQSYTFVISDEPYIMSSSEGVSAPFAAVGVAVVSNIRLVLDGQTLAKVISGVINTWLHPDILASNPYGLSTTSGRLLNASQSITVVRSPYMCGASFTTLMQGYWPSYTGPVAPGTPDHDTDLIACSAVVALPFALTVAPFSPAIPAQLQVASITNAAGASASPSWQTLQSCANSTNGPLTASTNPTCYPLAQRLYLTIRRSQCNVVTDPAHTATVDWVEWLLKGSALASALQQQGMAPMQELMDTQQNTFEALQAISCAPSDTGSSTTLIIVVCCVAVVLVIFTALSGVFIWRASAAARALRKQFSNENVAQECAEAIARFDLQAVEWLREVQKPNPIQKSFLRIIALLTEVKPFIPDQLLSHLMHGPVEDIEEAEATNHIIGVSPQLSPKSCGRNEDARSRSSNSRSECCSHVELLGKGRSPGLPSSDWVRRKCVYLHAKFGFAGTGDPPLTQMSAVAAYIAEVGKAHQATIDRVRLDAVSLHWGVTHVISSASARATAAAAEMQAIRSTSLAQWKDFWIQICVGVGPCDNTTLSAAGHRYFVMWGKEMQIAIEVAHNELGKNVRCEVLLTNSLYNEVRYDMKCAPRLWHNDVLLWEPVSRLASNTGVADEWMYELQNIEEKDKNSAQALQELLAAVKDGALPDIIRKKVRCLRVEYSDSLTIADHATLDYILNQVH